ncbi:MAG: hypothetical protein ONB48_12270 [candidate division KSB1 bacterium]|nr:hypothetical protein [candidate division KSB1 bacterium]MDZ7274048.1 hypothetical protein [candidate division KSB1 bacterium]MDZ7286421.1 hypothetical protein [candidate division KSB1 bacterium]MDZ7296649.1 hypothetical protein [candidate division KSB1 bacterium]MDZ7307266.1 hypothetical protein [candidate division KSB1 bacterium]
MIKPRPSEDFLRLVRDAVMRSQTMRLFERTREKMQEMQQESNTLRGLQILPRASKVDVFLHYAINNILASLADLKSLAHSLSRSQPPSHVCNLINCPRHAERCQALADAVTVLQRTKGSFNSKELAALRRRSEELLVQHHLHNGSRAGGV